MIETKNLIATQLILKMHMKMIETYGNAVVLKAILVRSAVL